MNAHASTTLFPLLKITSVLVTSFIPSYLIKLTDEYTGYCSSSRPPPDGTVVLLRQARTTLAATQSCPFVFRREYRRDLGTRSQKPLVSFSQVTLTWCKRRESITQWWIDYSHVSFWEPIFLCELNLKLNLLLLSPFVSDRWMGPVKRSRFESVTGGIWGQRSICFQPFGCVQNVDQNGNFGCDAFSYGKRLWFMRDESCCTWTQLTTQLQLQHHICGDSGCFIIWMNSFPTSQNHLVKWAQFDLMRHHYMEPKRLFRTAVEQGTF